MAAEDKLKVLVSLCTQLITYATARDYMEEGFDQWVDEGSKWFNVLKTVFQSSTQLNDAIVT